MKVLLIGYGKMGHEIEKVLEERGHEIVGRTGKVSHQDLIAMVNPKDAQVAIEFTHPEAAVENIRFCLERKIPIVSGTTGWKDKLEEVKEMVNRHHGAFIHSSNFSIGVNLFFYLNKILAQLMNGRKEYRPSIKEIHHTEKVDCPSGTAIVLAEEILKENKQLKTWKNERSNAEEVLEIISKREEDVKGTHTVTYKGPVDTIEMRHVAHSRKGFAEGAVIAAEWIIGKSGVFTMEDLLQIYYPAPQ